MISSFTLTLLVTLIFSIKLIIDTLKMIFSIPFIMVDISVVLITESIVVLCGHVGSVVENSLSQD